LCDAARDGIAVRILIPGEHTDTELSKYAGAADYRELVDAGVRIRTFDRTFVHAKLMTVDGVVSCFGSANLNHRSMSKDEECCVVAISADLAKILHRSFEDDWSCSTDLTQERWQAAVGYIVSKGPFCASGSSSSNNLLRFVALHQPII